MLLAFIVAGLAVTGAIALAGRLASWWALGIALAIYLAISSGVLLMSFRVLDDREDAGEDDPD